MAAKSTRRRLTSRRLYRLLVLAGAFFVLSMAFWLARVEWLRSVPPKPLPPAHVELTPMGFAGSNRQTGTIVAERPLVMTNLPAPETFRTFVYRSGKPATLGIIVTCKDSYYTVLIFSGQVDYRQNISSARYNTATPCPSQGQIKEVIPLAKLGLEAGEYYVVRAQQGKSGGWYEPY